MVPFESLLTNYNAYFAYNGGPIESRIERRYFQ